MTDIRCATQDPAVMVSRYDVPRALRLALADVRDDDDAIALINAEVADCPNCWRGIARVLSGAVGGMALSQANNNQELVEQNLEAQLAAALDEQL